MLVLRAFADHNPIYKDIKISHIEKSFFKNTPRFAQIPKRNHQKRIQIGGIS